ncbi:unnamed protein product [Urochloa humidicola]
MASAATRTTPLLPAPSFCAPEDQGLRWPSGARRLGHPGPLPLPNRRRASSPASAAARHAPILHDAIAPPLPAVPRRSSSRRRRGAGSGGAPPDADPAAPSLWEGAVQGDSRAGGNAEAEDSTTAARLSGSISWRRSAAPAAAADRSGSMAGLASGGGRSTGRQRRSTGRLPCFLRHLCAPSRRPRARA